MLGAGRLGVREALEGFSDVAWHGEINSAVHVVPLDLEAEIEIAIPVSRDLVLRVEDIPEMLSVLTADVFDTKVVNHKGETDRAGDVGEQTGRVGRGGVAMGREVGKEGVIGEAAGLREAVHAATDLGVDITVVHKGAEVVVLKDVLGDVRDLDPHVLIVVHRGAEVEIFDVHRHELGARGGDDTVEEELGGGKARRFGADFTRVIDAVAADGEADTTGLGFLGSVRDNEAKVGGCAAGRAWR